MERIREQLNSKNNENLKGILTSERESVNFWDILRVIKTRKTKHRWKRRKREREREGVKE